MTSKPPKLPRKEAQLANPEFIAHPECEDCRHRWKHRTACRTCKRIFERDRPAKVSCSEKCSTAFRNHTQYLRRKAALIAAREKVKEQRSRLRLVE
jgi:hypothetical protein